MLVHSPLLTAACVAFLSHVAAAAPQTCTPQTLVPATPNGPQWFGSEVAIDGDRMLVAAVAESRVYGFSRAPGTNDWSQTQRIVPLALGTQMRFGSALDLEGDVAVIAAPGTPGNDFGGVVHVYGIDTGTDLWVRSQTITVPSPRLFGTMVELEGPYLFVTEARAIGGLSLVAWIGEVHVYERDAATGRYEPLQVIEGVERHGNNLFSSGAVLVDPDTLLLADEQLTVGGDDEAGGILVLERNATTGLFDVADRLVAPIPNESGGFGHTLHWDGRQLVVSEPWDRDSGTFGSTHVYERDASGDFIHLQQLNTPDPALSRQFGWVGGLDDGSMLITNSVSIPGAVPAIVRRYLRDDLTGLWSPIAAWADPEIPRSQDSHRASVVRGSTLVTASARSITPGLPQGRVFVYDGRECDTIGATYCTPATFNSTGRSAQLRAYGDAVATGGTLFVRGTDLPPGRPALLLVSSEAMRSMPAASQGTLCVGAFGTLGAGALTSSDGGSVTVEVDLQSIPTAMGPRPAVPGETLYFQAWFRDANPVPTSNFTDGTSVLIR